MKRAIAELLISLFTGGRRKAALWIAFALFAAAFLASGWMIFRWLAETMSSRTLFGELSYIKENVSDIQENVSENADMADIKEGVSEDADIDVKKSVSEDAGDAEGVSDAPTFAVIDAREILEEYRELAARNPDLFGWVRIPDTPIDYPVMRTPDNPEYYIDHDFNKQPSVYGVPFAQPNCDADTSDNIIIHAHHMKDGTMFARLLSYQSREFWEKHPIIEFDAPHEKREYEVMAAFRVPASGGFRYTAFVFAQGEADFDAYIEKCRSLSLYETGITAEYGDRLITLATCEYTLDDGRFVVVGRRKAERPVK